ncbi:MAG: YihY/virulence factor BrkB family protein [Acidobacteria bacterium]|nr:YihY/virulence factor BrkB family protein [Acidobacteriota bacterium]MBI3264384.1 YihY/virulence factor BrkB family protein [Acidobacteriota bacterium]
MRWSARWAGSSIALIARAARRAIVSLYNSNDLTHAASIAYYALLSLFPFLLLAASILGSATSNDHDRQAILNFVFKYFPAQIEFVRAQLEALQQSPVKFGIGGSLALIWASLGVFMAVTSAVNEAWKVDKQRSFLKHRLVAFLMLATSGVLLILSVAVLALVQFAETHRFATLLTRFPALDVFRSVILSYSASLLLMIVVGLILYFVPNAKVEMRDVWIGAVLTGLLWEGAFRGFGWYLGHSAGLTRMHGSIAGIVVFLLWVYISSVILLFGAEFTASYARLRRHRPEGLPAAPSPRT